ncbi:MAG: GvpL/GvpF family gas vesicle protein [Pseudomonadota bacterium]
MVEAPTSTISPDQRRDCVGARAGKAFVETNANPLMLIGLTDCSATLATAPPHRLIRCDGWAAIALEIAVPTDPDDAQILTWAAAQNEVLAAYIARHDVLPVAIGAAFSDREAMNQHITVNQSAFAREAAGILGCVEYALTLDPKPLSNTETVFASGQNFLRSAKHRKQSLSHERAQFMRDVVAQTRCYALKVIPERGNASRLARVCALIPRASQDAFLAAMLGFAPRSHALGLDCRLIGPSPAYSFVRGVPQEDG